MKKIILALFLVAGAASLHAQDSTKHKMQHKMSSDSSHKSWNKSDTSMHHNKMKSGKMKKDSSK